METIQELKTKEFINLEKCFDEHGYFKNGYTPKECPSTPQQETIEEILFDEDRNAKVWCQTIEEFISKHDFSPFSDIVKYFYSSIIPIVTNGNYNSGIIWSRYF